MELAHRYAEAFKRHADLVDPAALRAYREAYAAFESRVGDG